VCLTMHGTREVGRAPTERTALLRLIISKKHYMSLWLNMRNMWSDFLQRCDKLNLRDRQSFGVRYTNAAT
jgi:hypothetical protein